MSGFDLELHWLPPLAFKAQKAYRLPDFLCSPFSSAPAFDDPDLPPLSEKALEEYEDIMEDHRWEEDPDPLPALSPYTHMQSRLEPTLGVPAGADPYPHVGDGRVEAGLWVSSPQPPPPLPSVPTPRHSPLPQFPPSSRRVSSVLVCPCPQ